jgi:hypothetical protein
VGREHWSNAAKEKPGCDLEDPVLLFKRVCLCVVPRCLAHLQFKNSCCPRWGEWQCLVRGNAKVLFADAGSSNIGRIAGKADHFQPIIPRQSPAHPEVIAAGLFRVAACQRGHPSLRPSRSFRQPCLSPLFPSNPSSHRAHDPRCIYSCAVS